MELSDFEYGTVLVSSAVTFLITLFLAIVVIYKNYENERNRVFFIWMTISALNSFLVLIGTLFKALYFYEIAVLVSLLDPCIALHFILLFSFMHDKVSKKPLAAAVYAPAFLAILILIFARSINFQLFAVGSFLYSLLMSAIVFLAIFLLIITYMKSKNKIVRFQMLFISIGIFIMYGGFFLTTFIPLLGPLLPGSVVNILPQLLLMIFVPASSILLAFTVLRFNLMGVEKVIIKGIVYSIISFIVVVLFILIGEVLELFMEDVTILGQRVPGILTALMIALLILPLQGRIEKVVNKFIPKKEDPEVRKMKLDSYRTAMKTAYEDENITHKEKRLLNTLRSSLEITQEEHEAIEIELRDVK